MSSSTGQDPPQPYEIRPDTQKLTHNNSDPSQNAPTGVDYEPHPEKSIPISPEHEQIVRHITNLYSGSANETDMRVYAEKAIYDDPWSYCDTRYKVAGQWYGTCSVPLSLRAQLQRTKGGNHFPPPGLEMTNNLRSSSSLAVSNNRHPETDGVL